MAGLIAGATTIAAGVALLPSYGLVSDRRPGRVETAIARRLVTLSIPASVRDLTNPNAPKGDAWRAGAKHFGEHCAVCHGTDGRGRTELASRMYPPVPDLADPAIQRMSDGALFAIIQNGVRWTGMPAFRSIHTSDETWTLVSFVRRIPRLRPEDLRGAGAGAADAPDHAGAEVAIDGTSFVPSEVTVTSGQTVVWVNKDPFPHTVSSATGGFYSREIGPAQQWKSRATRPGTFPYVCTLHPGMRGTLIVRP